MTSASRGLSGRLLLTLLLILVLAWVARLKLHRGPAPGAEPLGLPENWGTTERFVFGSGEESTVVVRQGADFRLLAPLNDRGEAVLLSDVERQARVLKAERILPDTAWASYGLAPPRSWVRLHSADGLSWGLALGDSSPVEACIYARPLQGSQRLLLLDLFLARKYFRPGLSALRDKVAVPLRPGPVDSIAVLAPGRSLYARRVSRDSWISRIPARLPLDAIILDQVVQMLRSPEIQGFTDPGVPLEKLGLEPARAVWVLYQEGHADSVRIGNPTANQASIYILPAGRGLPAVIESEHFRDLVDGWPALAGRKLLSVAPESLTDVACGFAGSTHAFRWDGESWKTRPGGAVVPAESRFKDELHNLTSLRWRRFPEPPVTPRGPERMTFVLRTASRAESLTLGAPVDSVGWARSSLQNRWGEVSARVWALWKSRLTSP